MPDEPTRETQPAEYHCGHCNAGLDDYANFFVLPIIAGHPQFIVVLPLRCPECGQAIAQVGQPSKLAMARMIPPLPMRG
jgi:Zn finger protein HypA/HybF involved in hydrogenase expression